MSDHAAGALAQDAAGTLAQGYDGLLFDLDGTLFRGSEPIPGAAEALRAAPTAIGFVTNNASRAPHEVAAHLVDLGFEATADQVMTSAQAALALLAESATPEDTRVLVVGHESFRELAREAGYRVVLSADDHPDVVLQGLSKTLAWSDLAEGGLAIRAGARWIATNLDPTIPTERGFLPGNGSFVAAMRTATEAEPEVAGKPKPGAFTSAAAAIGSRRALVVGDRLDTDISGAVAAGMDSLAVLTGHVTVAGLLDAAPAERPTHLGGSVVALGEPDAATRISRPDGLVAEGRGAVIEVVAAPADLHGLDLARAVIAAAWEAGAREVEADGELADRLRSADVPVR